MNSKGRRSRPSGVWMQHRVLESTNFITLTPKAVKLLMQVAAEYKGSNNGDFCVTWKLMEPKGWSSKSQLAEAREELLHYGFLELTRQGGRHKASLYAVTWESIDRCKGKLDVPATKVASNLWQKQYPPYIPKRKRKLKAVPRISGQSTPTVGAISDAATPGT